MNESPQQTMLYYEKELDSHINLLLGFPFGLDDYGLSHLGRFCEICLCPHSDLLCLILSPYENIVALGTFGSVTSGVLG